MSDERLIALARRAGIAPEWRDAFGEDHNVSADTLRAVLAVLGLPAGSEAEIAASEDKLREQEGGASLPPLVTASAERRHRRPFRERRLQPCDAAAFLIDADPSRHIGREARCLVRQFRHLARLDEFGEAGLVDIASDANRMHMRRMVERMIAAEQGALAAE